MAKGSGSIRVTPHQRNIEIVTLSLNNFVEVHQRVANLASKRLRNILEEKLRNGYSRDTNNFKFGKLSTNVVNKFEELTGITIQNRDMYTGQKALFHHRGGQKADSDKETSYEDIINMPKNIGNMDVYIHTGALIFTDYRNKFVLQPNQKIKIGKDKIIVTNHVSSSKVKDASDFTEEKGYKKITL